MTIPLKLFLYNILTQLIILLGTARSWLVPHDKMQMRRDRTFYATNFESWECCDCGAWHATRPLDGQGVHMPHFKFIPMRPKGYQYKMRFGGSPSSEFKDER